jgi:hypothetical protein
MEELLHFVKMRSRWDVGNTNNTLEARMCFKDRFLPARRRFRAAIDTCSVAGGPGIVTELDVISLALDAVQHALESGHPPRPEEARGLR